MDIPSEVKKVTTPSGAHVIEHKAYLTGEDVRSNRRLFLRLNEEGKGKTVDALEASENALMSEIILTIDGSADDIPGRVVKMRASDYYFIIELVNSVSKGIDEVKEETSGGSTPTSSEVAK
jgi:hypothetical protein